jgi:hypothetical protein
MSDVTVAPAGSAPPAVQNEVPINENPVASPTPIGSQAPDKPTGDIKGSEARPPSRREAIQKAFERAANPPPKGEKPPQKAAPVAEAKPGHNHPPEQTEGLDLKKRPADQPRGDRGQFAPRQQDVPRQQNPQPGQQQAPQARPLPEGTPYRDPPQRFSEKAKQDWAAAPESVRADIHRMHQEFNGAYQQYRADHEAMNPIRHFQEMATSHGTTLQRALSNYVAMETKLRQDVIGGLDIIVNNLNLQTPEGRKLNLRDIAYHVLNQSPEQHKLVQTSNAQNAQSQQIGQLHQMVNSLAQGIQQMQTAQQFSYTRSAVDQFADAHPRFDELGDLIENELKFGFDLETAYRRAELLRPGTHAAQTRNSTTAQTRPIDRSISGAPDAGPSNGTSRKSEKPVGRREAIQNAIKRVNGSL